jgi:hypothetical protein
MLAIAAVSLLMAGLLTGMTAVRDTQSACTLAGSIMLVKSAIRQQQP